MSVTSFYPTAQQIGTTEALHTFILAMAQYLLLTAKWHSNIYEKQASTFSNYACINPPGRSFFARALTGAAERQPSLKTATTGVLLLEYTCTMGKVHSTKLKYSGLAIIQTLIFCPSG